MVRGSMVRESGQVIHDLRFGRGGIGSEGPRLRGE